MSEIKPAMDAEEWAVHLAYGDISLDKRIGYACDEVALELPRHALAALALHGQPFGFTREDVRNIQWAAKVMERTYSEDKSIPIFRSLADRIEALLPPEA